VGEEIKDFSRGSNNPADSAQPAVDSLARPKNPAATDPNRQPRNRVLPPGARLLLSAACFVVLVAGLRAAGEILRPFVLSLFLASISLPLLTWLCRRGLPKILAVVTTVLTVVLVIAGIVWLVAGSLNTLTEQLPGYQQRMGELVASLQAQVDRLGLSGDPVILKDALNAEALVGVARNTVARVASILSKSLLVLLTLSFILFEATGIQAKLQLAFGLDLDTKALARAMREIQSYLVIKTAISLATGLLLWGWVSLMGLDFAALWGLLAFLLNYIPNLGSIFAAVPAVLLALIQQGPGAAFLVAIGYLLVNFLLGNLLEPNLMGRRFGLSTLVVFTSLVFWGWVWGPLGMLLSVPLTMVLKILLENIQDLRWLAILLGPNAAPISR
jgi:predicted PurR-regulated permease PerM